MAIINRVLTLSEDGLQPWFVKRVTELASAVGRVSVAGHAFATGFLISPKLLLTCAHVLPDVATASGSLLELDYQRDEDGTFRRVTTVKLHPHTAFITDQTLDFTVVGLGTELTDRPVIPLADDGNTAPGERVTLFHHPQGGPLQLSLHGGTVLASYDDVLHHDASTQAGSAGAPVLDHNLRLIGLHHSSVLRGDERARSTDSSGPGVFVANEAIRATAIVAALAQVGPTLFAQTNAVKERGALRVARRANSIQSEPAALLASTQEIVQVSAVAVRDSVFISYARADQGKRKWRERLRTFLLPFGKELDVWDDSRIETGAQWRTEIDIALKRARVAVLLIGPSFLGSEFVAKNELPPLLRAAAEEGVVILPLITNHCSYEKTALGKYQAFNDPKKPLEALELSEQNRWLQKFSEQIDDAFHRSDKT